MRQALATRDIEQPADTKGRIEEEAGAGICGRLEATLQDIINEDARFLHVRVQITQTVVHGSRYRRLYNLGGRSQYLLVRRHHMTIYLLIGIVDRQRCVPGQPRTRTQQRQCPCDRPFRPTSSATSTVHLNSGSEPNISGFVRRRGACTNAAVTDLAAGRRVMIRLAGTPCEDCHFFASPLNFTTGNFATNYGRSGNESPWRWVAIKAGWKMTAAARVVSSDRAISLPDATGGARVM